MCNMLLLKNEIAERQVKYFARLLKNTNNLFKLNNIYLLHSSLFKNISTLFKKDYNINIVGNDIDAIKARIAWVQRNEHHSNNIFFFNF